MTGSYDSKLIFTNTTLLKRFISFLCIRDYFKSFYGFVSRQRISKEPFSKLSVDDKDEGERRSDMSVSKVQSLFVVCRSVCRLEFLSEIPHGFEKHPYPTSRSSSGSSTDVSSLRFNFNTKVCNMGLKAMWDLTLAIRTPIT